MFGILSVLVKQRPVTCDLGPVTCTLAPPMITLREVNLRASVLKLVSSSDLLCSIDFCHYDAMLEEKNNIKAYQIHPFLACDEE